jgi:molecular chaperone GrpE
MTEDKINPSSYEAMTQNTQEGISSDTLKQGQAKDSDLNQDVTNDTPHSTQAALESTIEQLEQKLKEKEKEIQEQKLRSLADINNLQQRYQRESINQKTYAHQYLAKDILDVADALDQALQSMDGEQLKGIQLIQDMLNKALAKHGIEMLDPSNAIYNHNEHEAMAMQPSETVENNHIIQVIQKGYKLKDRLLRPARVIVAKNVEEN